jgi:chemotaxis protein CheC
MEDVRDLKEPQLDAIREVANIGAGHAATALSQMTNRTIMITVPRVKIKPLEDACDMLGPPDQVVASVLMHMMGDLTGRAMLLFPERAACVLCDFLFRREPGTTTTNFGEMEQSGLKEAGNILASAYLNALSDFMGMMLVPSVPSLVIDLCGAVLTSAHLNFGHDREFAFCVETAFCIEGIPAPMAGHFLLLPDVASLRSIFDAIRIP